MEQNIHIIDYAQHIAEQGKREEALSLLREVNCLRANWIKGNVSILNNFNMNVSKIDEKCNVEFRHAGVFLVTNLLTLATNIYF